ncbi:MAG: WG repeat-containing protein [Bacteroidia bacterium]
MNNTLKNILFLLLFFLLTNCSTTKEIASFKSGNKFGYKTLDGEIIVKPEFDVVGSFENGFAQVEEGNKWGFINEKGKLVSELKYENDGWFSKEGIAHVKLNGLYGFIDKTGKEIIPFVYEDTWGFNDGIAMVKKNGLWGFIDTKGTIVIPIEYTDFKYNRWSEGVIGACKNQKWGFIDRNNKIVIPFDYTDVGVFSEGLALASESYEKWGYIDHNNNKVIPFIYENPDFCGFDSPGFVNGIAQVRLNNKSGYVNKKNEIVIPLKYYCIQTFYNGYAFAEVDSGAQTLGGWDNKVFQYGYVASSGKEYFKDYKDLKTYDWKVGSAPKELPDFSDTLIFPPKVKEENYSYGVYEPISFAVSKDSTGKEMYDTVFDPNTPPPIKPEVKKEEPLQKEEKWTLTKILNNALNAFTEEPKTYADLNRIKEIAIGYGLMLDAGNYGDFMYSTDRWDIFKKETIYKIIATESLRKTAWNWAAPYYKKAFQTMHPFHQQAYKSVASYLKNYINSYDLKKVNRFLKRDEKKFAFYDSNGKYDPCRKLSSFVDRLIIVHKALSVEDAKVWINKISDEVLSW